MPVAVGTVCAAERCSVVQLHLTVEGVYAATRGFFG